MKMNFSFNVTARCRKYDKNDIDSDVFSKEDIDLNFNIESASRFLLRFYEPYFMVGEYKLIFKIGDNGKLIGITVLDNDNYYIITNPNQLINDVIKGYNYLIAMDKITDILEFDFKAGIEFNGDVEDEFSE